MLGLALGNIGITGGNIAAWSPLALWPDGAATPGMWISPRTLASSFADSAGTTPVATPGTVADTSNPVGLALDIRAGATVLTDPGNHMLQSTSPSRPLLSAYDGQTLGPGDTYDATGFPIAQRYDGVDDGMATAAFSAGTLTSGMDCMIAVRRDSAGSSAVCGLHRMEGSTQFIAAADPGQGWPATSGAGSPTTWVDGAQLAGGTATSAGTLHTALTVGDWHILELRGLDLSAWTSLCFGWYGSNYNLNGARGDIMLYPSTASPADKAAARQWLADYYGVTLA